MLVWSVFFHLPNFVLLLLVFAYLYISQGSAKTHLPCGGKYDSCIIANCLLIVPVKEFWKSIDEDKDKSKVTRFYGLQCI